MRKLTVFNNMTLDGYFSGPGGDLGWCHRDDPELNEFVDGNATRGGELLFGRVTYDMMVSFWPTAQAAQMFPVVAERMNGMPKLVFSRTLDKVSWNNTTLLGGDLAAEVRRLKNAPGKDIAILGSGSIVGQLAPEGLIDEYQVVVNPVVLGKGKTMFEGVEKRVELELTNSRVFRRGNVWLCYKPKG